MLTVLDQVSLLIPLANSTKDNTTYKNQIKDLYNSRLYRYGIEEGYILLEINNNKVNDIADVDSVTLSSLSSMLFLKPDGEKERIVFE